MQLHIGWWKGNNFKCLKCCPDISVNITGIQWRLLRKPWDRNKTDRQANNWQEAHSLWKGKHLAFSEELYLSNDNFIWMTQGWQSLRCTNLFWIVIYLSNTFKYVQVSPFDSHSIFYAILPNYLEISSFYLIVRMKAGATLTINRTAWGLYPRKE